MKKFIPFGLVAIFGVAAFIFGMYFQGGQQIGQQGEPRGGPGPNSTSTRNLTVVRTDSIFNGTFVAPGAVGMRVMEFKVTNHSTTTTYSLDSFGFYPGVQDSAGSNYVRNLRLTSGGTQVWRAETLAFGYASSTPSLMLPPLTSKSFALTADIFGSPSSTCPIPASTIMQVALGIIQARGSLTPSSIEPVYNEMTDAALARPSIPLDNSIESAVFYR